LLKKNVVYTTFHPTFADFKAAINAFFEALPGMRDGLALLRKQFLWLRGIEPVCPFPSSDGYNEPRAVEGWPGALASLRPFGPLAKEHLSPASPYRLRHKALQTIY
jgi:hypothetical protein